MSKFSGKVVRLRNGKVTGPVKEVKGGSRNLFRNAYPLTDGTYTWTIDGKNVMNGPDNEYDIVEIADTFSFFDNVGEIQLLDPKPSHGRIYLAGPMAGYPERNYPAFHKAAKALRDLGYEVYNPAEYDGQGTDEFPLREAFTEYTNYILNRADIIALLPGHEKSVGATAELSLARVVKLKEIYL